MSDASTIEWTDATWNPTTGCTRVSEGCDHCYIPRTAAFRIQHRSFDKPGVGGTTGVTSHPDRLDLPLRWRKPRRVFVNSLSDLFHARVPDEFIARVFAVMALARQHTFQVLTKRPGRMRSLLSRKKFREQVQRAALKQAGDRAPWLVEPWWPLRNVWLGVSVEDQKWANVRIPALLDTPAAVRFLSCEPLLGPVDLHWCGGVDAIERDWVGGPGGGMGAPHPFVDWVIVGGESGPGARPMHPDWARTLRDQCAAADVKVPYFFKQWGGRTPKSNGRVLDGRTWDEYPQAVTPCPA